MIKKNIVLLTLLLIPSIKTSSESCGILIKELHYYIECSSSIFDKDLEEIESNEQDILHIRRGGYGELNKLTISSEETGFECILNLKNFHDFSHEKIEQNNVLWLAQNNNVIVSYNEFIKFPRVLVTTKNPRKNYCFNIRKVHQIIGTKNKKFEPVEIEDFKEAFINWLKNEDDEEDDEDE